MKKCSCCGAQIVTSSQSFFQVGLERLVVCLACFREVRPTWGVKT